jgi:DNA-binding MarR family transcriptional regulator
MAGASRARLLTEMGDTMRMFTARAVLFQDAVARWAGMRPADLQCVNLLVLLGPATPAELAGRVGLAAGDAIADVIDRLERAGLARRGDDPDDVVTADPDRLWHRVGPLYTRVGRRWAEYLATLNDEEISFATELFAVAAEVNREEIARLYDSPHPN